MSRCRQTDSLLDSSLAGIDLTRAQAEHASRCQMCARAVMTSNRFDGALRRLAADLSPEQMPRPSAIARTSPPQARATTIARWRGGISARTGRPWIALAAAIVVLVVVAGVVSAPDSVLGSWTSVPTSSERGALDDTTVRACREQAATLQHVGEAAGWPEDSNLELVDRLPLVAHDQRGEASAALFAGEDESAALICAVIPVAGQPPYVELGGGGELVPDDFGPIEIWTATAGWNSDYGGRWEVAGKVDGQVARVTMIREDGRDVVATIDHGWFLAWWPSESEPVSVDLHAADGELIERISLGARYAHEPSCKLSFLDRICLWR